LPIGRFLKSKSIGGNRVILVVELNRSAQEFGLTFLEVVDVDRRACVDG
jgi:hypothetical protein